MSGATFQVEIRAFYVGRRQGQKSRTLYCYERADGKQDVFNFPKPLGRLPVIGAIYLLRSDGAGSFARDPKMLMEPEVEDPLTMNWVAEDEAHGAALAIERAAKRLSTDRLGRMSLNDLARFARRLNKADRAALIGRIIDRMLP